jgi:hypothetical protein
MKADLRMSAQKSNELKPAQSGLCHFIIDKKMGMNESTNISATIVTLFPPLSLPPSQYDMIRAE